MKTALGKLYHGFRRTKAVLCVTIVLVYTGLVVFSGGSLPELLLFVAAVAGFVLLPGLLLAHLLQVGQLVQGLTLPLAILLGSGAFAAVFCVAKRLGFMPLLYVVFPALSVVYLLLWLRPGQGAGMGLKARSLNALRRVAPRHLGANTWLLVLLWAGLVFVYAFAGVAKYGRPSAVGDVLINQDLLWNVGNAESFAIAFPPQDIRFMGVRLHYHYLTELLAGALAAATGIPAYNVLAFYMQPAMLAAAVVCLYRFGRVLWGKTSGKAVGFVFALFAFSCASLWEILPNGISLFWNAHITHLVTNVNSVTTSVVFLCIFLGLWLPLVRAKGRVPFVHHLLVVVAFFMLTFAKGPLAILVLVALVLSVLVGVPLRQTGWPMLVQVAVLGGLFALVYTTMFASGANDSMAFSLYGTLEKGYFYNALQGFNRLSVSNSQLAQYACFVVLYFAQSFLMLPAQFPLYLRGVGHDIRHFKTLTSERLLFNAVAVGGLLAFFLFNHTAMSQMYFAFGSVFFITLLAVDNIDFLRGSVKDMPKRAFRVVCALCAVAGVATSLFLYTHLLGSGLRQTLRNAGVAEKYPYDIVMNADDEAAALWLRENTGKDTVFATNRIHTGARLEGISNLYSAFSGRQAFAEGYQYAQTNMGVPKTEVDRRRAVINALFDPDTAPDEVQSLMRENSIHYLLFTTQMSTNFDGYYAEAGAQMEALVVVLESETVTIYALPEYE